MDPYTPPMTLSPQSPPTGSTANNAVFRPRRSDDWHEYREVIEQLYRSDQLKLRDVKRIMERDYKFIASEKQYKDRLAAWNVRKNIKAAEVQVLIRKKAKRAARGKATAFRRAGQEVDQKRLTRFVRRYGHTWVKPRDKDEELGSPEPTTETPSDMSCYTPEPEDETPTPVSPLDVHSPTRETPPYPLNYDPNNIATMPDLVIGDEQSYPMGMHSQSHSHSNPPTRRPYHPSELSRPTHTHPSLQSIINSTHSTPRPQIQTLPAARPSIYSSVHPPVTTATTTSSSHVSTHVSAHVSNHHDDIDAPGEVVHHNDEWNRLDTFQTRLEGLQYTLDRTMSKWDAPDSNQEMSHHEGLGL
ncbi:hypothetical protein N7540_009947 [Penicillium herquei]|nr:hypothetical protein N7540_009947 [Penicillium herquei]